MHSTEQYNAVVMAQVVREPEVPESRPRMSDWQFSLATMFVVVTVSAFLLAAVAQFGAEWFMQGAISLAILLVLLIPFALVWGLCFRLAPTPTKYVTVLGLIMFLPLSLLPCWLIQNREQARRTQCMTNLRKLAASIHYDDSMPGTYWPGAGISNQSEPVPDSIVLRSGQKYPAYEP